MTDDPARGQVEAGGQDRVADLAAAEQPARVQELSPGRAVDRTVDTAAAEQTGVRRVDDRVDREVCDVAPVDLYSHLGVIPKPYGHGCKSRLGAPVRRWRGRAAVGWLSAVR